MSAAAAPSRGLFLSLLIGAPIRDRAGEPIARVHDLIARLDLESQERYPPLTGIVAQLGGREVFMPWGLVGEVDQDGIRLARAAVDLARFERRPGEVLLARDVLDKQLVDVNGRRIIRASDIVLAVQGLVVRVIGVDVGFAALWRRAAPRAVGRGVVRASAIDWQDVEYLAREAPEVVLRGGHPKIARLHPVEIAQLVDQLPNRLGAEIVESLEDAVAADVVEELSDERQTEIVERMAQARAADVLEEMEPDEAAHVFAHLPKETAADLLAEMEPEDAADVRELLAYPEGTAGRLMNTELAAVAQDATAAEALAVLRALPARPQFLHYLYVIEPATERLVGSVALADVALAEPDAPIAELMTPDVAHARPESTVAEIAELAAEYNLLALPVVDDAGRILGIVTVDDVMEELVPEGARRLPRIFG